MTRQTSIYLDLIRFSAALVVFVGHVSGQRLTQGFMWQIAPFMAEAVTIFFVLSGYVIAFVKDHKESTAASFLVSRAARIGSVAYPALAITFLLDPMGRLLDPSAYNMSWGYSSRHQIWQIVANGLFVNQLWFTDTAPGSDLPFWSLSFEVWYYIIFACSTFLVGRRRLFAVTISLLIVGPQIAAMFPIWLIGVGCYYLSRNWRMSGFQGSLLCFGCAACWVGYEVLAGHHRRLIGFAPPILGRPELAQDYIVAILFAGHLLGLNAISRFMTIPDRIADAVRWTAGATFSLYLFHLPIAQFLSVISPWPLSSAANRSLVFGGTMLAVFALAEITERKKQMWRMALGSLVARSSFLSLERR